MTARSQTCLMALCAVLGGSRALAEDFRPEVCLFRLSSDRVAAGGSLTMSFEFVNRGGPTGAEDTVFVHIRPASAGFADVPPAAGADFRPTAPTYLWARGALAVERDRAVSIPPDFPAGTYNLFIGFYDPGGGDRVALANDDLATPDRRYLLATFEVLPAGTVAEGQPVERRFAETEGLPSVWEALEMPRAVPELALATASARVTLAADEPRVLRYAIPAGTIGAAVRWWPTRARYFRAADESCRSIRLESGDFAVEQPGEGTVRYTATVRDGDALAARFSVRFQLEDERLTVSVGEVEEQPGYLLTEVTLPALLGVHGDGGAFAVPNDGGRLIPTPDCGEGRVPIRMDWFTGDLCAVALQGRAVAACRTRDWDNELSVTFAGEEGARVGDLVVRFPLRAEAKPPAAQMLLAREPSVEVGLLESAETGPDAGWVAAAKWLRRDTVEGPKAIYRDCLIYKIFCDSPGAADFTTYDDALAIIREVHRLAPWLKQVVYLVGWQYSGHDTGYPATDVLNPRLGTIEDLRRVTEEAARLGAILSFHDNFDDAYRESPAWDESVIARNESGALSAGGVWAGGQSYILAFAKYAERYGRERVRRTLAMLPVRESYHIDVLSAVPLRRDYNPESPENTRESLDGKLAILDEFDLHGVDVTSEGFTAPFVGHIGHAWHFWHRPTTYVPGERAIPFLAFIYHGGPTCYGNGAQTAHYAQDSALHGAGFSTDWMKGIAPADIARAIYEVNVPWAALRERRMEGFVREGSVRTVRYGPETFVRVDEASGAWRVEVDGETLVDDGLVTLRRPGLLAAYSPTVREVRLTLPEELRGAPVRAMNAITGDELPLARVGDEVALELPAGAPVHIQVRQDEP